VLALRQTGLAVASVGLEINLSHRRMKPAVIRKRASITLLSGGERQRTTLFEKEPFLSMGLMPPMLYGLVVTV
jgi:hypothetical protein